MIEDGPFALYAFRVHRNGYFGYAVTRGRTQAEARQYILKFTQDVVDLNDVDIRWRREYETNHEPGWSHRVPVWLRSLEGE